jgi:ferredoxin
MDRVDRNQHLTVFIDIAEKNNGGRSKSSGNSIKPDSRTLIKRENRVAKVCKKGDAESSGKEIDFHYQIHSKEPQNCMEMQMSKTTPYIKINSLHCDRCYECINICPTKALIKHNYDEEKLAPFPIHSNCICCMACIEICKKNAITIEGCK